MKNGSYGEGQAKVAYYRQSILWTLKILFSLYMLARFLDVKSSNSLGGKNEEASA